MNFEFTKTMQEATDAELIKIVSTDRDNYQEAALIAAEKELKKRNLSSEAISQANSINAKIDEEKEHKANMPLELHWKVLTFIIPGLFQLMLSGAFKGDGYDRKANELVKWTLYGFGFYAGLIILINIL